MAGRLFWCQGEGGAPTQLPLLPAPHKTPLCAASRRTQSPCTLELVPGRRDPLPAQEPRGCHTERASKASQLPPGRGGWQQRHARSRSPGRGATCIPMLQGRAAPHRALCPHSLGPGTSAGTPGRLWHGGKLCTFPAGGHSLPEEPQQPWLGHKGCPRLRLALPPHHCGKGKGCREMCG